MSIRCSLGWHTPMTYGSQGRIGDPYHDGINRAHRRITYKCARCDEQIHAGSVIDTYKAPADSSRETGESKS